MAKKSNKIQELPGLSLGGSTQTSHKKARAKGSGDAFAAKKPRVKKSKAKTGGSTHKAGRRSLDPAREKLAVLADRANKIFMEQSKGGIVSRAALEAERTLTPSHRRDFYEPYGEMFSSNLKSTKEINRELARVMTFLSDYNSQYSGVNPEAVNHQTGLFGAQWRSNGGGGYDPSRVSEADAEKVFDLYHRVIEAGGGWERVIGYFRLMNPGIIEYGSENLINSIYDMVQNRDYLDLSEGNTWEGEIIARSLGIIETMKETYEDLAELQRSGNDYGSILSQSELNINTSYWNYLKKQKR